MKKKCTYCEKVKVVGKHKTQPTKINPPHCRRCCFSPKALWVRI